MTVHSHSVFSFQSLNIGQRRAAVLAIYAEHDEPLTDRAAAAFLPDVPFGDVKPRISELVDAKFLYEVDSIKCPVTRKTVRRCSYTGLVTPL